MGRRPWTNRWGMRGRTGLVLRLVKLSDSVGRSIGLSAGRPLVGATSKELRKPTAVTRPGRRVTHRGAAAVRRVGREPARNPAHSRRRATLLLFCACDCRSESPSLTPTTRGFQIGPLPGPHPCRAPLRRRHPASLKSGVRLAGGLKRLTRRKRLPGLQPRPDARAESVSTGPHHLPRPTSRTAGVSRGRVYAKRFGLANKIDRNSRAGRAGAC